MARAEINSGVCGFHTSVVTSMDEEGETCSIHIDSQCEAIQRLAQVLIEVQPFEEISFRRKTPTILALGAKFCTHAACPVPVGVIKAVEVAAGLALPRDVQIQLTK